MSKQWCSVCCAMHDDVTGGCFLETMTRPGNWERVRVPAICPLCLGSGIRSKVGKENAPLPFSATAAEPNCHGCDGKGWVTP